MIRVATAFSGGFGSVEFALKYLNIPHVVVFACEWMKPQRESYILNHGEPTSNFYEDIRTLDGTKYKGEIDYYHLSPPCQSYSLAGSRGGAADDRGGLMFEAIKSIDEVQPKMFTVENVKGLLSSNNGEDWKNIIRDFKSLKGYTISWGVMNAKEQGTPQNRERVFIVGFRGQSTQFSFPQRQELNVLLYDLLEDSVDDKYFLSEKMMNGFIAQENQQSEINKIGFINQDTQASQVIDTDGISSTLNAGTHGYCQGYIKYSLVQVGNIDQKGHNSLLGRVYGTNGIAPTQNAKGGGAGAKTGLFIVQTPRGNNKGGKKALDGICPTLSICSWQHNNHLVDNNTIRRLTPRECARVQGDFKDMFKFGNASDTKLYEFIGNAMDINTTKNLISKMLHHLNNVKINEPSGHSFKIKETQSLNLFEMETA